LDISKAKDRIGREPRWRLQEALKATVEWHHKWLTGSDMKAFSLEQIKLYGYI
jgi:CDP-glucose 4,6-dehydratase